MQFLQILIDGFAISSLYALGAIGFTLIFGVSGVLNLSHGGVMVVAALIGWYAAGSLEFGTYLGSLAGVLAAVLLAYLTYFLIVRPIQLSRTISSDETEIFVLTATLLWGIMIQVGMSYVFSDNPVTMRPMVGGIADIFGVRTPINEIFIAVICWVAIALLWLFVNRTDAGKALLAASINARGVVLLGFDLSHIYWLVWGIYGLLTGIAGILLASFLGVSTSNVGQLTASAFTIVVLGGLGSVGGSLIAAYVVGYLETATAYLIAPTLRPIPALILLVLIIYARPQGLLGRR